MLCCFLECSHSPPPNSGAMGSQSEWALTTAGYPHQPRVSPPTRSIPTDPEYPHPPGASPPTRSIPTDPEYPHRHGLSPPARAIPDTEHGNQRVKISAEDSRYFRFVRHLKEGVAEPAHFFSNHITYEIHLFISDLDNVQYVFLPWLRIYVDGLKSS